MERVHYISFISRLNYRAREELSRGVFPFPSVELEAILGTSKKDQQEFSLPLERGHAVRSVCILSFREFKVLPSTQFSRSSGTKHRETPDPLLLTTLMGLTCIWITNYSSKTSKHQSFIFIDFSKFFFFLCFTKDRRDPMIIPSVPRLKLLRGIRPRLCQSPTRKWLLSCTRGKPKRPRGI